MTLERLHPEDLALLADMVADRVAARLGEGSRSTPGPDALLSAAQVAERFGVGRRWVYDHAEQLGVIKIANGERSPLRFDPARVAAELAARSTGKGSPPADRQQRRRSRRLEAVPDRAELPLLPVRGV